MTELEIFELIDYSIDKFVKNEGFGKSIKISKDPHSDWLVFNWRQLTWKENNILYFIEITPNFDNEENISSWTSYTAASYDLNKKRFYLNKSFAEEKELIFIAENIDKLLSDSFLYITGITKDEIPFRVDLK
jgi:hypothetical protein